MIYFNNQCVWENISQCYGFSGVKINSSKITYKPSINTRINTQIRGRLLHKQHLFNPTLNKRPCDLDLHIQRLRINL